MPNVSREITTMQFCSRHWDGENYLLHGYSSVMFFCVILTITATLGNSLILFALHKDKSLYPASKLLLRCLTVTDLCVGLIGQPTTITLILSTVNENWNLCEVAKNLAYVTTTLCSGVSLATLTAISVDRLLALLLGLRYRQVVTVKRVRTIIFLFWLESSAAGILYVWDMTAYFITGAVLVMLQVIISTYSYAKILCTFRRLQKQLKFTFGGPRGSISPKMARYKRTVFNALWVHLTLATCYLPSAVVMTVAATKGLSPPLFLAEFLAVNLIYLNSSLNPLLYCWKIKEVRQAVKETLRQTWAFVSRKPAEKN